MSQASDILDQVPSLGGKASTGSVDTPAPVAEEPATLTAPPLSEAPATPPPFNGQSIAGHVLVQAELSDNTQQLLKAIELRLFGKTDEDIPHQAAESEAALSTKLRCLLHNNRNNCFRLQAILEAL